MRYFSLFLFILAGALQAQLVMPCNRSLSADALAKSYGRGNVQQGMVYVAEGEEVPGTILFPRDERRRVEIVWRDVRRRQSPEWMRLPAPSQWTFAGVQTGMPLAKVEKLNGKPFRLSGFDWDYGGFVTNWRGGQLARAGAPCRIQVRFEQTVSDDPTPAEQRALENTAGERELSSADANMKLVRPRVSEIVIQYPE